MFQPLIVSPERYEELENRGLVDGYIVVDVQAPKILRGVRIATQGIDSNRLTAEERGLYDAKIPLADIFGGFDYPIKSIEIFGISSDQVVDSHVLSTSEYNVSLGNLYFTSSLGKFIPIYSQEYYYKLVIQIAKIIPDDGTEKTARSALGIATTYAVMDYFDQYSYAQTTAQMIAEVGYTEIMTITSTAISAPFIAAGSYAAKPAQDAVAESSKLWVKTVEKVSQQSIAKTTEHATKFALNSLILEIGKRAIWGTIKETVEEIVIDGFFETAIQSAVRMTGGSDAAGHWLSTLFTSVRETANFGYLTGTGSSSAQGFAGQVQTAMELSTEFESIVSEMMVENSELSLAQIAVANEQFLTAKMAELEVLEKTYMNDKITLGQIFATGLFTGLSLIAPSLAGFNLYAISKLGGSFGSKIDARTQNKFLATRNLKMLDKNAMDIEMQKAELSKKPIVTQTENNLPKRVLSVSRLPEVARSLIETKLVEAAIAGANTMSRLGFFDESGRPMRPAQINQKFFNEIMVQEIREKKAKVEQNQDVIEDLSGKVSEVLTEIKEDTSLIELRAMNALIKSLKGKKYGESLILVDNNKFNGIYFKIVDTIMDKSKNGEILTQLENDILDVAMFVMGGKLKFDFASEFQVFIDKVNQQFVELGISETFKDYFALNEIMFKDFENSDLDSFIEELKSGRRQNIYERAISDGEGILDLWYTRIESKIMSTGHRHSESVLFTIKDLFDRYYEISGWSGVNYFYRDVRKLTFKIGEILSENNLIERNRINDLTSFTSPDSGTYPKSLFSCKHDKNHIPSIGEDSPIETFSDKLFGAIDKDKSVSENIKEKVKRQITSLIKEYKEKVYNYRAVFDILEESQVPDTNRRILVSRILAIAPEIQAYCSTGIEALSELLFGSKFAYRDFLRTDLRSGKKVDSKLDLSRVNKILVSILEWTPEKFTSFGISMDDNKLNAIKKKVKFEIDNWVFENCYDPAYIGGVAFKKIALNSEFRSDYDFVQLLWLVCAIHEGDPTFSFAKIKKSKVLDIGIHLSSSVLALNQPLNAKSMKKVIVKLLEFYNERYGRPGSTREVTLYAIAAMEAVKYASKRGYKLSNLLKPVWFDRRLWSEEYVKGYHVIMGIGRHLGIDPITFEPLDDNIFRKIKNKISNFARHHKDRNKPDSLLIWDNILTNSVNHQKYWAKLSKAQSNQVIKAYETLMVMKGTGTNNDITKSDIEKRFKDSGWLYDEIIVKNWFDNPNFNFEQNLLPEFNERREDMKNLGLKGFLSHKDQGRYKIVYERFYENVKRDNPCELYSILHGYHQIDDIYKVIEQVGRTLDTSLYGRFSFGTAYAALLSIDGRVVRW